MYKTILSISIFFAFSLSINAQSIQLENLRVSNRESKNVYVGIENHFAVKGNALIKDILPTEGVSIYKDTLSIRAYTVGSLPITFITATGRETIIFEKQVISDPKISIGNNIDHIVSKTGLLQQRSIQFVTGLNESFWEGYKIDSFQVEINGLHFSEHGQDFSAALVKAIQQTKAGDEISIRNIKAYNNDLQKDLNMAGKRTFKIN